MNKHEKKLLSAFRSLDQQAQRSLLDFAEFLCGRTIEQSLQEPEILERPVLESPSDNESVVAAIKRLQRSYKMLDTNSLFNEASSLMTAHIVQGRAADEVIAELEALFDQHYQSYLSPSKSYT